MASTTAATTTTPATTATPHSTPAERAQPLKLSMQKKEALAAALDGVMAKWAPQLPGVAFGVTTAEGQVYASYAGNRVYGEPDQGPVDKDTSESPHPPLKPCFSAPRCSPSSANLSVPAVQHDEACHLARGAAGG